MSAALRRELSDRDNVKATARIAKVRGNDFGEFTEVKSLMSMVARNSLKR